MPQSMVAFQEAIGAQAYVKAAVDSVTKATPSFKLLYEEREKSWVPEIINLPIYLENSNNFGTRKRSQQVNVNITAKELRGQWKYCEFWFAWGIDRSDIDYAGEAAVSIVEARAKQAAAQGRYNLDSRFLQDKNSFTDDPDVEGVQRVMSTSTTHGEIAPGTYANWKAQNPALATANTLAKRDLMKFIALAEETMPGGRKILMGNAHVCAKIASLVESNQRIPTGQDAKLADLGFPNFTVWGVPVYSDTQIAGGGDGSTNNHIYLINLDALKLFVHPDDDMNTEEIDEKRDRSIAYVTYCKLQLIDYLRWAHVFRTDINPAL